MAVPDEFSIDGAVASQKRRVFLHRKKSKEQQWRLSSIKWKRCVCSSPD